MRIQRICWWILRACALIIVAGSIMHYCKFIF